MVEIRNTQRTVSVDVARLAKDANIMLDTLDYHGYDLSIWITNNATVRRYNRDFRNIDKATDILSFPYHDLMPGQRIVPRTEYDRHLGDLIISAPYVHDLYPGAAFYERLQILLAHGISHLLGYDHDTPEHDQHMCGQEELLLNAVYRQQE